MPTRAEHIEVIRTFPQVLEALVRDFTPEQLTTAYNAPEWTIAQNVHHLADSHLNSYLRFKFILNEDNPTLRRYNEAVWAQNVDAQDAELSTTFAILRGLHARWTQLMQSVSEADWQRKGHFSATDEITLDAIPALYADHCRAHLKQIQEVIDKMPR
jgi:hypothetical protein